MSFFGKDTCGKEFRDWLRKVVPHLNTYLRDIIVHKANQLYYDPNSAIAFIYDIDLVKSLAKTSKLKRELTDEEAMKVLLMVYNHFQQEPIINLMYEFIEEL